MLNSELKDYVSRYVLAGVRTPAQYLGGELNMVRKDHNTVRGRLCLAFPDVYQIGMSHHGLQVLYSLMNSRDDWACERVFAPWLDMEQALRQHALPLYSLETFTPVGQFDVLGFSLQYELLNTNVLTMLDLAGIPLRAADRTMAHPLVIAGGPCVQNPEPMAPFMDVFISGDGEPTLQRVCDSWLQLSELQNESATARSARGRTNCSTDLSQRDLLSGSGTKTESGVEQGRGGKETREELLLQLAKELPFCYVPRFHEPEYRAGRLVALNRRRPELPERIERAVLTDLENAPIPTRQIVPYVECVHDRIAIEIMRGCPSACRFCQSTAIKRPVRFRSIDTIVQGAWEGYRHTGMNEISILSLSSSDYPRFEDLVRKLKEVFDPLGVNISVPSLRVNDQFKTIADLIGNKRRSSLTLAPEVARDDMRQQIRKRIKNEDLYEGCRAAFQRNFESVKLYFMCGLPGERPVDLEGIIDMAETIARIGKQERGRYPRVTANISNFVPKPHTPYQWNGMRTREYFQWAHEYLWQKKSLRCVKLKRHDIDTSMLEGVISRGDRRVGEAIELAWRRGARMDSWSEQLNPDRWWTALADAGLDVHELLHRPFALHEHLPWDHINVKFSRDHLEKEQARSAAQLEQMRRQT
ncbi:MAG: radical SAM protein [Pirellulaceae bacterium]